MPLPLILSHHLGRIILLLISLGRRVTASKTTYCSEINTSTGNSNSSVYQSNGLCTDFCLKKFAFAILQDQNCWCSNFIPATTTTGCTLNCPGYPFEKCGGDGLYGYIELGKVSPSGTLEPSPTSQKTSTSDPPQSTTSTSTVTTSVTSLTWIPTPITSVKTISGSGLTVTVVPTAAPVPSVSSTASPKHSNSGLSTGAAVGLTASLVALVAVLCSIIYLYLRKRKEQKVQDDASIGGLRGDSAGLGCQSPSRTMSENSRYVLGTDGRRVVETWEFKDDSGPTPGRMVPVDPRLDPFSQVYRTGENKSRDSVNTLRDDLDYSRRVHGGHRGPILRATNPD